MIILINVLAALILVVILSALMLAPSRLRRPFAEGHTHRQRAALRAQAGPRQRGGATSIAGASARPHGAGSKRFSAARKPAGRSTYPDSLASVFRSVLTQDGKNG
jgi:hypothetical protein